MEMNPIPVLVGAHICSMLGFATFAALLPELRDAWALTNAQAGIVGGMFFAGYVAAGSSWTALTRRSDEGKGYGAGAPAAAPGRGGVARPAPGRPLARF